MPSNDDDDNENENENNKTLIIIKELNDALDEIIDKSKSFEDQIKSIKKVENLNEFYFINGYGDKEFFKTLYHHKLFKHIFGHAFETLANKLINTTNKEENQIIVNNIEKHKDKLYEEEETSNNYVIQPSDRRVDLIDAINVILKFNETI